MVVRLTASALETGRRVVARKMRAQVTRVAPEIDDLFPIARLEKQIRELLWHRGVPDNLRLAHLLVRQLARLQIGYERRHGVTPNTKRIS